jgi:hypothetical protein
MLKLHITASTTTEEIEAAIPFLDMRKEAIERRDDALAVAEEQGDQEVLELHEFGDVLVLFSPVFGYALVNEKTAGVGDSMLIDSGGADSAEHAAQQWIAA